MATMNVNDAFGQLQGQFKTRFNRDMNAGEVDALKQYTGYTGGDVTSDQFAKAQQGIGQYSGDLKNPWGTPQTQPTGAPTAPTAPTTPSMQQASQGSVNNQTAANTATNQLITQGYTDAMANVDPNNPAMVAQRQAFNRANATSTSRARLAAAERAAARGTAGSGGFDAELGAIEQGAGDRSTNFESQLMSQELAGQRDRVMRGIEMANATGNAEMSRQLQERLGNLDAQLRRDGMNLQGALGRGQLNLGLLQALMGDRRAGDALGFNYAALGQQANQSLLNTILSQL